MTDQGFRPLRRSFASLLVGVSLVGMTGAVPAFAQTAQSTGNSGTSSPGTGQSGTGSPTGTGSGTGQAGTSRVADASDEIIVTGIRQANLNAIRIKRNSDTVVDAITAEDIGALPDKSITETLQRIPGVAINHFAAINDPDHVSEEGQSPVIRGLPYVNSQFNGRDAFTANRGRALNFQDIPPDLAASVEVYKNQTADQIEGGIAGIINIVTRRPLDTSKNLFVVNADAIWGDLRKDVRPEVSGLFSHQWDTGAGRIGILGSASYSQLNTRVDNARVTTYRDRRSADPTRNILASNFGGVTGGAPGVDYYVPLGGGYSRQDNDRERIGFSGALQWESADQRLLGTLQYIHSGTVQTYTERTIAPVEDGGDSGNVDIAGGVGAATFDANNVFLKGVLNTGNGNGIDTQELNRGERTRATTNDYSAHLAWKPTERLHIDLDGQYATSTSYTLDTSVVAVASTIQTIDNTGDIPQIAFSQPTRFSGNFSNATGVPTSGYNNQPIGFFTNGTSPTVDPNTTFWRSAQDHQDNTTGDEFAFRADGSYEMGGLLKRIRFGARYADRKQTIRSDGYNWGNLSERWNAGITTPAQATPAGFGVIDLGSFFRGQTPATQIYGFLGNPAIGYDQLQQGVQAIKAIHPSFGYNPLPTGSRNGSGPDLNSIINGAGDGFHKLSEISKNDEETIAGYGRIDFTLVDGKGPGGWTIDGNIGLRYVHTNSVSSGYYTVPNIQTIFPGLAVANGTVTLDCSNPANGRTSVAGGRPGYNLCLNTPEFRNAIFKYFGTANATDTFNATSNSYDDFLPSLNVRVATEKAQFRFAYSKGITRPSFNDLRNHTEFGIIAPVGTLTADAAFPVPSITASAYGNPLLRPTKSDNFDLTAEWYYAKQGSLTVGFFYKQLENVYSVLNGIASFNGNVANNIGVDPANPSVINFTNNGTTLPAFISVTANNNRKVGLRGVEIDFRQGNFDFLPSPLDGIGVSANFTYIDADKLKFQPVLAANYDSSPGSGYNPGTGYLTSFPFPGVSKFNANAEIFYEKYGIQARLAYTWRSKYFVSSQDSLGPNDPTYTGSTGFMDASLFYAINKNIKIGVTGNNLLNETVTTYNVINRAGLQALRGINQQDRRFTAGLRLGF